MFKLMKSILILAALSGAFPAFAEDAYLESDGTQYIVTGYHPTEKMNLVADFQIVTAAKNKSILGNKDDGGVGASFLVWMNNSMNLGFFCIIGHGGGDEKLRTSLLSAA